MQSWEGTSRTSPSSPPHLEELGQVVEPLGPSSPPLPLRSRLRNRILDWELEAVQTTPGRCLAFSLPPFHSIPSFGFLRIRPPGWIT